MKKFKTARELADSILNPYKRQNKVFDPEAFGRIVDHPNYQEVVDFLRKNRGLSIPELQKYITEKTGVTDANEKVLEKLISSGDKPQTKRKPRKKDEFESVLDEINKRR